MKIIAVLFACFLTAIQTLGQVTVEVQLDSSGYLANEPLVARVRINNESGSTIRLADAPNWIVFTVAPTEGGFVRQLRTPELPKEPFDLESSKVATIKVDLAPAFDLARIGRYKVTAAIRVSAFNTSFASNGKNFFISNGTKRWETTFGVPTSIAPLTEDGSPELRKYYLLEANFASESRLYARVTDRYEKNIRVIPIGPLLSFSHVEHQVDKWMNLHVLYQNGAQSFVYCMINPDGFVIARERHEFTDTRPALTGNEQGRIVIRGGARRYSTHDIPPVDPKLIGPPETDTAILPYEEVPVRSRKPAEKKPAPPENAKKSKK